MKQLVSVNLTTRTAKDWTPPTLTFGERLTLALRFSKTSEGEEIDANLTINSLKAAVGLVDARPAGGKFAIKIGTAPEDASNTTALLEVNAAASEIATALNAVPAQAAYGDARVIFTDDSWLIFFGAQSQQVTMTVVNNGLWPISFGRITAWQVDGKWVHELRLTQAPVAFTTSHDIVLPPAPVITRLQAGGTDGTFTWNEIQELYVPAEFRGAYVIKKGYGKTTLLSREDDTDSIEEALQALGAGDFKVALPLSNRPNIEFIGDYAGSAQDLLVVQVEQSPAGDLTFTLDFDRAELAVALRRSEGAVTLPLEIRIIGTDENGFTGELAALVLPVTIQRPVIFDELEERPVIDWLVPASPKTYVPFGANQIITGQKYYSVSVGDGVLSAFVVTTGLGTDQVFVFARENVSGGRQLIDGTDFTAEIDSANQVTVTALLGAPAANAWLITVIGAQAVAAWASDLTVTVPQVVAGNGYLSLPDFMDNVGTRLDALEALLPLAGVAGAASGLKDTSFELPDFGEVLADVSTLDQSVTLASQIVVPADAAAAPAPPEGTDLAAEIARDEEEAAAAERDPDALPANIIYRAVIPGIGRTAAFAVPAVKDDAGTVVTPEIPAVDADPAVWPARPLSGKLPLLLPAATDASVADVTSLPAHAAGSVWRYTGTPDDLLLPGGAGRKSQKVPTNGNFASDGRAFYRVVQQGATTIYHPLEMERELWRVFLDDAQFPDGAELYVAGEIRARLVGEPFDAASRDVPRVDYGAQYVLVCEAVPVAGTTAAGAAGTVVTLGSTRLTMSPLLETFRWELTVRREAGAVSSSWLAYRKAQAGAGLVVPSVLRLRLIQWDVDDSSEDPRGQVAFIMPQTKLEIRAL